MNIRTTLQKIHDRSKITRYILYTVLYAVFAPFYFTGLLLFWITKPFLALIGLARDNFANGWWGVTLYWILRILLIFPFYQVLLVIYGWLFGQFKFFWEFEKKMLSRMGLGFLFR